MARSSKPPPAVKLKKKAKPSKPVGGGVRPWLVAFLLWPTLGILTAVLGLSALLYRGALATVDGRLAGEVWTLPAHVWSGPITVWEGLRLAPEALADDLVAAGYARVSEAARPGDFQLGGGALLVKPKGEGKRADVLVTFADGRVRSITPGGRLELDPAVLATLRGPDNENRSPVPLAEIPPHVRNAVLAMEDARFFEHTGIDPIGIARALWVDLLRQELAQGGSTLTQQVAKNLFLSHDRTAARKLREVLLAFALERRLGKEEILHLYLTEIYLGQAGSSAVCGVDAAARAYFGKPVQRLDLGEAATLGGIIASPNSWSPIRHPDEARARRDVALTRMVDAGFVSAAEADAARKAPLDVHPAVSARQAPYATDRAVELVEAELGEGAVIRDALEVRTTLVPALQRLAEEAVAEGSAELVKAHPKLGKVQMALVAVRASDGAIVAMVGGRDYAASNFNRAAAAARPIGSTVKPLTLLVALEADPSLSPATRVDDSPIERTHDGKTWRPANYDGSFLGPISLRRAVALSRNVPAVLLAERVGFGTLRDRLRALGLSGATDYPSASLGGFEATPVELAGAYAAFVARDGARRPWLVREATDANGRAAWSPTAPEPSARYSERARWLAASVMGTVMKEGTGKAAAAYGVGEGVLGKSGTTDGYRDAWFAGAVPTSAGGYAVVVWVGFDRNEPVGLTGSKAALPTWARFVAGTGLGTRFPARPDSVVAGEVCEDTDLPPCPGCAATRPEYWSAGHAPTAECGPLAGLPGEPGDGLFKRLGALFGLNRDPEAPERDDRLGPDGVPVPE